MGVASENENENASRLPIDILDTVTEHSRENQGQTVDRGSQLDNRTKV